MNNIKTRISKYGRLKLKMSLPVLSEKILRRIDELTEGVYGSVSLFLHLRLAVYKHFTRHTDGDARDHSARYAFNDI